MIFENDGGKIVGKGPIAKFIPEAAQAELIARSGIKAGDALFFAADKTERAAKLAGLARTRIGAGPNAPQPPGKFDGLLR